MSNRRLIIYGVVAVVVIVFAVRWWRGSSGERFDAARQKTEQQVRDLQAERDQLRGENNALRQANEQSRARIAQLEAGEEALQAIVREAGGRVAQEQQKLQQIEETLKNDEAIINAPTDRCLRCRRYSATALAQRLIDRPLACSDECGGQP